MWIPKYNEPSAARLNTSATNMCKYICVISSWGPRFQDNLWTARLQHSSPGLCLMHVAPYDEELPEPGRNQIVKLHQDGEDKRASHSYWSWNPAAAGGKEE